MALSQTIANSSLTNQPDWVLEMYKDNPDIGILIEKYEQYYRTEPFVKNNHTQYYKRLIRKIGREHNRTPEEDRAYMQLNTKTAKNRNTVANWQSIGPYDWDHTAAAKSYAPGSAHVYTVEQSVSNPNVIYAGTATAGLWRSNNKGLNWTSLTDGFLQNTVYAIEIDHTNENVLYLDFQNSIYKSTNGGSTFTPTGNATFQALNLEIRDIRMSPSNNQILFACTDQGLFRTSNAGATWTNILSGDFQEVEIHPTNHSVIYAVLVNGTRTEFYKSVNAGLNFTMITNGWPVPPTNGEQKRTEIAVSADNPNFVYAQCTGAANGGSGLYGVYISADQGASWTFQCCGPQPAGVPSISNPNLMGWNDDGTDDGGQYYYDMGFAVSPTNSDSVFLAGVNLWVSGNGGSTFTCPSKWSHSSKPNYVHADIHDVHYYAHSRELWVACDGGIFYSNDNGANFQRRNVGITGTDFWGFGQGWWYGDVMLGGAYHNGTLLREENVYTNDWLCTDGGDGTMGFVNPGIDRQVYSQYNIKTLKSNRNISPETRSFNFKPNNTYITGKSSDLLIHPLYYGQWLSGSGTKLYQTKDNGLTFTELYDFGADIAAMDQCWSNPNVIYACTFPDWWGLKRIYRSDNGGTSWTEITPNTNILNGNTWIPYDIAVDNNDPMKVWIVRTSMYDSNINGYSVYSSTNGGTTWQNISGSGLNGQSPTSCFLQKGTNGGLYVGTRKAVYYKNHNMTDWELFNTGLPVSTNSTRLEGYYRKQKLRNATNRSVWETNFFENSTPIAFPSAQAQTIHCNRDTVYFVDHSIVSDQNVSWNWSFPGGVPASSTLRNPKVIYTNPGEYDVTLTVTDNFGTSTKTVNNIILIENKCLVDTFPGLALLASGDEQHGLVPNFNMNAVDSLTVTAWIKPTGIQPDYSAIFMGDGTNAAGLNFKDGTNKLAYHWPGGSWSWNSNINVPANEWSFVALVVKPTGITVYCNEQQATHNFTLTPTDIPAFRIGSYRNWASRNMNGLIDEVAIYDRPLTTAQLRDLRHLTKKPESDASLIAYYQFNTTDVNDYDKVGTKHIYMTAGATKTNSGAPVGNGISQKMSINSGGLKDYSTVGVKLYMPSTGTYPNGEVVITKLFQSPNITPSNGLPSNCYWIVNNYGTNANFSTLDSIRLSNSGNISGGCIKSAFTLQTRVPNSDANSWANGDQADNYDAYATPPHVTFSTNNNITSAKQLYLALEPKVNGNPVEICNGIDDNCNGLIDETYSLEVTNGNDSGANSLRAIMNCAQNGDIITFAAGLDTITLLSPIIVNKNITWTDNISPKIVIQANLSSSGFASSSSMLTISTNITLNCNDIHLRQQNNSQYKPLLQNFGQLNMTNCNVSGDPTSVLKHENGSGFSAQGLVEIK